MKNKNIVKACLLFLTLSSLSGCGDSSEVPEVSEGKDTIISSLKGKPDENDAKNVLFATLGKLESSLTYQKDSSNTVTATKGIINYKQESTATMIRNGDEYYVDSLSKSAFVDMEHIAFYKNEKVAYQNKDEEIKTATYDTYFAVYGVTPIKLLSGQIFNQETVLLASLDETKDDTYTFTYVLDMNKANDLIAHQTKVFGGLNSLPTYLEHTTLTLTIDSSYTPISYTYTTKYSIDIAVLGSLDCEETCSASFSKFNETIEVPNSEALNAAINETPTSIVIEEDITDYGDLSAIIDALLTSDFSSGIAISGSLKVDNYYLPLKLKAKADIDKILDGEDVIKQIDAEMSFSTFYGDISFLYHDNKLYVDLLSRKVVFALPSIDESSDVSLDTITIASLINVKKSESKANTYTVSLQDDVMNMFKQTLASMGLCSSDSDINFNIDLYVTNNHIAGVYANLTIDERNVFGTNFMYQDEVFSLPNLDEYVSELSLDTKLKTDVGSAEGTSLDIHVKYNTLETDLTKAIEVYSSLVLSSKIKNQLSAGSGMDMPYIVTSMQYADNLDIIYQDGMLSLVAVKDGTPFFYDKNNLFPNFVSISDETTNKSRNTRSFSPLSLLGAVQVHANLNEGLKIYLDEDYILNNIDTLEVQGKLATLLINNLGEIGSSLLTAFNLNYPIASISINVPLFADDLVTLDVSAYNVKIDKMTWNTSSIKDASKTNFFKFSIAKASEEECDFDYDYSSIRAFEEDAYSYAEKYDEFVNDYSNVTNYASSLDAFIEEFKGLDNVKKVCANTFAGADILTQLNLIVSRANGFINASSSQQKSKYSLLSDASKAYILSGDNAELLTNYESSRKTSEEIAVATYISNLNNFEDKDVDSLSDADLLAYLKSRTTFISQGKSYISTDELTNAVNTFTENTKPVVKAYIVRYTTIFEEMASKYLNYEKTDSLTLDEMKANLTAMKSIASNYYTSLNGALSFAECVDSYSLSDFTSSIYLADYYFNNGLGNYAKSVRLSLNRIIKEIANSSDDNATKKANVTKVATFINSLGGNDKLANFEAYDELYKKFIYPYANTVIADILDNTSYDEDTKEDMVTELIEFFNVLPDNKRDYKRYDELYAQYADLIDDIW